jgi:hemolysin III
MKKWKDPVSAATHLAGAVFCVLGLVLLAVAGAQKSVWHLVSYSVFGVSAIGLYTASTVYHIVPGTGKLQQVLRKLDHVMIFVLIAGSYTPFCLVPLRGPWGWSLLAAIWGCALGGLVMKLLWMGAPRWLSTTLYVVMGWLVVVAAWPLAKSVAPSALGWLLAGGLFYTVGAVLYATKWPRLWPGKFGFHEVWHLFVMAGTFSHFVSVYGLK